MKKYLKVRDGYTIAYEENGSGDPVILVHGFTGNTGSWSKTLHALGSDYQCFSYDLLGHGETVFENADEFGEYALADQLHDLIEGLGLDDVIVIAHSLGCCVLYQYAEKYSCEHWKCAIMADMTPSMNTLPDWDLIAAGGFGSRAALEAMEADYDGYMKAFFGAAIPQMDMTDEVYKVVYEGWLANIRREIAPKVLASCQPDYRPALTKFTVPTAYFYADPGSILPRPSEIADCYEKLVPGKFLRVPFDVITHNFPEEYNELFIEKVKEFVEKN